MGRIIIVGAGYAGVEAALTLCKHKKQMKTLEIVIIDKNPYHTLLTEIHKVAGNRVAEDAIRVPLSEIFENTPVKVVTDTITRFAFEENTLYSETKSYTYDQLILALGSTPEFFGVPGLKEHGFSLWSYEDAVRIREHIKECFVRAEGEDDPDKRKSLLTFTVVGAGFTGVEMVGELIQWTRDLSKNHGIPYGEVRLINIDMLPCALPAMPEKNRAKAERYLKKMGVELLLGNAVRKVTREGFSTDSQSIASHTVIWAAGIRSNEAVDAMPFEKGMCHRVVVDSFCRTGIQNVYAAGDMAALKDEEGNPYPALVETALQTGRGAAKNALLALQGKEPESVTVKLHGTMVSIGNSYAVADLMGYKPPNLIARAMKFMVNAHYLWEICGFWKVAQYFYHEVYERRYRKGFLEKHYSTRVQAWWLAPLRVFFGSMWIFEGVKKIAEGWLTKLQLQQFLGFADAGTQATAAATGAPEGAAVAVDTFKLIDWGFFQVLYQEYEVAVVKTLSVFKINIPLLNDFLKWMLENDTVEWVMQAFVTIAEIALGLFILGGAFNFLANAATAGLLAMFISTTGLHQGQWWMPFTAFALMGGAGRAFGADYYLFPWLHRVWNYRHKNRRWRLFPKNSFRRPE